MFLLSNLMGRLEMTYLSSKGQLQQGARPAGRCMSPGMGTAQPLQGTGTSVWPPSR